MPSKSKKQSEFMCAVAHNKKFANKVNVPQSVGKDFCDADKGVFHEDNDHPTQNIEDIISMNVPLLIRLLEFAREDLKSDIDLHYVAENIIKLSLDHTLTMDDYEEIIHIKKDNIDRIKTLAGMNNF